MSDAYDLFIIDVVKNVMSELYPQSPAQTAAVSTAALVGAVLGQVVFGALALLDHEGIYRLGAQAAAGLP